MTTQPAGMPSFGPDAAPTYRRIPFRFSYLRGEDLEAQTFQFLAKPLDMSSANRLMLGLTVNQEQALPEIIGLIAKYMDNKDGTPHGWTPVEMSPKKDDPDTQRFRGPDGKIHPMDKAGDFLALERGSSRKRWLHLMHEDDYASVDIESIKKLTEFIVEIAAMRPTHASS